MLFILLGQWKEWSNKLRRKTRNLNTVIICFLPSRWQKNDISESRCVLEILYVCLMVVIQSLFCTIGSHPIPFLLKRQPEHVFIYYVLRIDSFFRFLNTKEYKLSILYGRRVDGMQWWDAYFFSSLSMRIMGEIICCVTTARVVKSKLCAD